MAQNQSVFSYSLPEVILVSAILIGLNVAGFVLANERRGDQEKVIVMNSPTPNSLLSNLQGNSSNTYTSKSNSNLENSNSAYWANGNVPPGVPLNENTSNSAANVYVTPSISSPFNPSNTDNTIESPSLSVDSINGKWTFVWSAGDAFLDIKNGSGTFRSPQQYVVVQKLNATSTADGQVLTSSGAFIENSSIRAPNYYPDSFLVQSTGGNGVTIFTKDNVNTTSWEKVQITYVKLADDGKSALIKLRLSQSEYVLNLSINPATDSITSAVIKHNAIYEVVQNITARTTNDGILVLGSNPVLVKGSDKAPTFAPDMFIFKKMNNSFSVMTKDDVYEKEWRDVIRK